ncbi:MAG: hypothetical protein AAGJ18_08550, partial [Bacteroidota bacterium]
SIMPFGGITDMQISQFYIRANTYLNGQNQFKPYFFVGLKGTYAAKGDITYNALSDFDPDDNNLIFGLLNFGLGTLYEFKNGLAIKAEVGNQFFPDAKVGIGWHFNR